jgi:hypothetical protein
VAPEVQTPGRGQAGGQKRAAERQGVSPAPQANAGRRVQAPEAQPPAGGQPGLQNRVRERQGVSPAPGRAPQQNRQGERPSVTPAPQAKGERRLQVPEGNFRGPDAERQLRTLPRDAGQIAARTQRDWLRGFNRPQAGGDQTRLVRDVIGNPITPQMPVVHRDTISRISVTYNRIRADFGAPQNRYVVLPRVPGSYWDGYWDGYGDGYLAARHRHHHGLVVIAFYYPFYFSDPYWFGFYYSGYYPSVYTYWGWCPPWIYPNRVYYAPMDYVYWPTTPYRYYPSSYRLDYAGAANAIEDIRQAWFQGKIDSLAYHLTDQLDIQVYLDGEYQYSTSTSDYYSQTVDAMATTDTVSLDFDNPIWISSAEVFYTGRHVFYDPDGNQQTVYVSYRLRNLGGQWYLVSIGSSLNPIQHQYHDFRYS